MPITYKLLIQVIRLFIDLSKFFSMFAAISSVGSIIGEITVYWPVLIDDRFKEFKYFRLVADLRISDSCVDDIIIKFTINHLIAKKVAIMRRKTNKSERMKEAFSCICANLCISLLYTEDRGCVVSCATYMKRSKFKAKRKYLNPERHYSSKEFSEVVDYLEEHKYLKKASGGQNSEQKGIFEKVTDSVKQIKGGNLTKFVPTSKFSKDIGEDYLKILEQPEIFYQEKQKPHVYVTKKMIQENESGEKITEKKRLEPVNCPNFNQTTFNQYTDLVIKLNSAIDATDFKVGFKRVPETIRKNNPNYFERYKSFIKALNGSETENGTGNKFTFEDPFQDEKEYIYYELASKSAHYNRVFSVDFKTGGRLYGRIASMKKEHRYSLQFDGEPTVELDWSGMHPSILYSLEGKQIPQDPYKTETKIPRGIVKKIVNILLNCTDKKKAIKAVVKELNASKHKLPNNHSAENAVNLCILELAQISKYFLTNAWGKLQFIESEIACNVVKKLLDQKILVLPVHDSFIVQEKYVPQAENAMRESYREVLSVETGVEVSNVRTPQIAKKNKVHRTKAS